MLRMATSSDAVSVHSMLQRYSDLASQNRETTDERKEKKNHTGVILSNGPAGCLTSSAEHFEKFKVLHANFLSVSCEIRCGGKWITVRGIITFLFTNTHTVCLSLSVTLTLIVSTQPKFWVARLVWIFHTNHGLKSSLNLLLNQNVQNNFLICN